MLLRRIVTILIVLPISLGLVMLAVANRQKIGLVVDPFGGAWSIEAPLYLVVFAALIVGVVIGGASVWLGQGRYRRAARRNEREARRARTQADELRAVVSAREGTAPSRPAGPPLAAVSSAPALADRRHAA
ncbi:lipopolysaccharide assembly protein LapA domain-containing protein [Ancylobacter amanitiformis]|uniref:Integral membrane protein n=1 Tax=Ancylobacter amanitiformis TaxID=217069 RepID=A0ABU0LR19_9HYPH|nr:lipopolysaccharide assembly protein LapA domain-containing protein [Ancylobacter amanitiformis]MDQ0511095.1 putative integral membrane protein [Ancylobacter amanitiformis]